MDKKSKTSKRGDCVGKVGPRSYLVDINGTIKRRNRRVIREAKDSAPLDCSIAMSHLPEFSKSNEEISPDIPITSSMQIKDQTTVTNKETRAETSKNQNVVEPPKVKQEVTKNKPTIAGEMVRTTGSGRIIKKPELLNL